MMKNLQAMPMTGFLAMLLISTMGYTQSMQESFYDRWERQDTAGMLDFLESWKKNEPYNPDVYVGFFNYYAIQTFEEQVSLLSEPPQDGSEYLEVMDSLNHVSGYLSSNAVINDSVLNIAFEWVDQAIALFPDRLDLRMGKVYLASATDQFEEVREGLVAALQAGDSLRYQWKWMQEEVIDSGQYFLYSSIQGHLYGLFEKQNPVADDIILDISQRIFQQDNSQFAAMTNIATVHLIKGHFDQALEWLKRADKMHEHDPIILSNLGYCYKQMEEWKKAKRYYQAAFKWSDEEGKTECQMQLNEIDELSKQ